VKCRAVADSLEEAGDRLFTFTRLPPSQWRSARTTNAVERLHEEFKRRINTQTVLPLPETAAMLFWALLATGQITMLKVDGWQTLKPTDALTSPPEPLTSNRWRHPSRHFSPHSRQHRNENAPPVIIALRSFHLRRQRVTRPHSETSTGALGSQHWQARVPGGVPAGLQSKRPMARKLV
jgi:hypothetical protein